MPQFPAGGGYMQMLVDVSINPSGNAWVSNNWRDPMSCYLKAAEGVSTRCGGQGMTLFYGMEAGARSADRAGQSPTIEHGLLTR